MSAILQKDKVFYLREESMAAVNKIVRCTKNTSISYTISSCKLYEVKDIVISEV